MYRLLQRSKLNDLKATYRQGLKVGFRKFDERFSEIQERRLAKKLSTVYLWKLAETCENA